MYIKISIPGLMKAAMESASMRRIVNAFPMGLALVVLAAVAVGCERTIEQEVVQPIEAMAARKDKASLQTATSNLRQVRMALMRYAVQSSDNRYPTDSEILDFDTLRDALASEGLPSDMAELKWDPGFGITYISDGYSFHLEVRALTSDMRLITATENGVSW